MLTEVKNELHKIGAEVFSFAGKYGFAHIREGELLFLKPRISFSVAEHQKADPKMDAP